MGGEVAGENNIVTNHRACPKGDAPFADKAAVCIGSGYGGVVETNADIGSKLSGADAGLYRILP